ncbi:hypothetical protein BT96DRAFT_79025 [Gymnopus androsaceus JB14]|uniref:Uncharacterized protein n=1 Tax=Gymnopus androsaceus JB14 TaxID=1447944 RepID=A0A6A4HID2_9AGAR|nr:hypothetical protein BT96DRAFT_79025 [Gymnopus androsaceus JB14]
MPDFSPISPQDFSLFAFTSIARFLSVCISYNLLAIMGLHAEHSYTAVESIVGSRYHPYQFTDILSTLLHLLHNALQSSKLPIEELFNAPLGWSLSAQRAPSGIQRGQEYSACSSRRSFRLPPRICTRIAVNIVYS